MTSRYAVVAGAHGFIGRHVARALAARGYRVAGLGHGNWHPDESKCWGIAEWREGDISVENMTALVGSAMPSIMVHCAGTSSISRSSAFPLDDLSRSMVTVAAMLEFARRHCAGRARIVLASSAAVYGNHSSAVCERSSLEPISHYGFNKKIAEEVCDFYARFYGVRATIIRCFSVYGAGNRKQLLWDAMNKFYAGNMRFFGSGEELRDWVHVNDVAGLMVLAGESSEDGLEIYNCGGYRASVRSVVQQLAAFAGVAGNVQFTGEVSAGNPLDLIGSSELAQARLGWRPRINLGEGLRQYVEWFRTSEAPVPPR